MSAPPDLHWFAQPGPDCPSCPAPRNAHDGWGSVLTGCRMPIALITPKPRPA